MEYYKIIRLALDELYKNGRFNLHRTTYEVNGTCYCGSYRMTEVTYKGHNYNIDFHRHRWEELNGEVRAPKKAGKIKIVVQDTILADNTTWIEVYY